MTGPARHLVVVGAGPWCTYALERLAASLAGRVPAAGLLVSVYDRTGPFGAGATHSDDQAQTSYLNRVASQIAFAADESTAPPEQLLPDGQRPTFAEWARDRYDRTGDPAFDLDPRAVPRRYLHGMALREAFDRHVALLRRLPGVRVDLHRAEVTDIVPEPAGTLRVTAADGEVRADHVLLVTGHSHNRPRPGSPAAVVAEHARQHRPAGYVPHAYPLREQVTDRSVPPGCTVGLLGLGLTAIDVLLYLTEGRGGTFVPRGPGPLDGLDYRRSGREPATVVAISPSGMFTSCRPENDKAVDPTGGGHSALEHRGVFLTAAAVRTLRETVGVPAALPAGEVRQLDFDRDVLPLVVLEMACLHYRVLLGDRFGRAVVAAAEPAVREFLRGRRDGSPGATVDRLLAPVQGCFDSLVRRLTGVPGPPGSRAADAEAEAAFHRTVHGPGGDDLAASPWGHSPVLAEHRFDRHALFEPLRPHEPRSGARWRDDLIRYLRLDNAAAAQGNLRNPTKAACDGVWRDLRSVFSQVLDFGGLTAASHRRYLVTAARSYARMSNGTGLEPMRKVRALVEAGVVDVSVGPGPVVEPVPGRPAFRLRGPLTGTVREVQILLEGRSHPFDPEWDAYPLYPALLRRGLVRRWRNPGRPPEPDLVPGALDLTADFHPIRADGTVERRLTVLGSPAEGLAFFQLSAARPRSGSAVLGAVARWAADVVRSVSATAA